MITLALAQMIFFFALQAPFTHGEDGIQAVPRGQLFGFLDLNDNFTLYYVVLTIFATCLLLIYRTLNPPFGQALKTLRNNEPRAGSLGSRVHNYTPTAFVLSPPLAGLPGATPTRTAERSCAT